MDIRIVFLLILVLVVATNKQVDAYTPVKYVCCYNYTNDSGIQLADFENKSLDGIQLDNFNNLSNWSLGGNLGAADVADTVNFKEGTQGIKLIAKYGNMTTYNRTFIDKSINKNFSAANNFGIWVYIYNVSTFDHGTIFFTSTPDWSKYFGGFISNLRPGWNKIVLNQNDFIQGVPSNPENWNNVMTNVRIAIYPTDGQDTNVTFGDLEYNVTNDWILGGVGGSLMVDTVNVKEGQQGLKLGATNGNSSFMDNTLNNNFSATNNFAIWTYIDNAENLNGIIIYFTSDPNWGKYFYDSSCCVYGVKTGWNKLIFNKHSFKNIGGENWNNVMNKIRLRLVPQPNSDVNVTFDDLRYDISGKRAKLMITFDDGYLSVYTKAYPILAANNQTGVSFFVTSWLGDPINPDMNLSNLKTLQRAGWDISSHTVDHCQGVPCTSLNDSALTSELNDSYAWLVTNGFQKSAGFIAYPFGASNDAMLDKVKQRYVLGRSTNPESAQQHFTPDDPIQYIQRTINLDNTTSVQSVEDSINDTINAKLLGILVLHDMTDSYPDCSVQDCTYQTLTSDFRSISNYIKSRSSDVDVITYSDYVIPTINSFTPVINKTTRIYSNGSSVLITNNKYDEYMPNMTVIPLSGSIDIGITNYNETNGHVSFNESSSNSNVTYNIGDRIPNRKYDVKIYWANGTLYQNFKPIANGTGHISYNSLGFGGSRYQEIVVAPPVDTTFTVTLPIGYAFLRFNASSSTIINLNPDGQNSSRPIFNITNNGNINQSFMLNLSNVVANITTYGDLNNNFSTGKIEINTSSATVIPNLVPGQNQNLWIIMDAKNAPVTNTNVTLMIHSGNNS